MSRRRAVAPPSLPLDEIRARCAANAAASKKADAASSSSDRRPSVATTHAPAPGIVETSAELFASSVDRIDFQHSVFCQTSLPYKNPGDEVREWERTQGAASLLIEAGHLTNPDGAGFVKLGLPFGEKARLVLIHINSEAVRTGSPEIQVQDSMTAFIGSLGLATHGRNIRTMKDQLTRLCRAHITLGVRIEGGTKTLNADIANEFDFWWPKDEHQRVLWQSTVWLSPKYFESLVRHAVPLDHRSIRALAHSAMALDVYTWLAQRLHRIPEGRPQFITWAALKGQFGPGYGRMDNFRRDFRSVLEVVLVQYRAAKLSDDGRGVTLRHSSPPVPKLAVTARSLTRGGLRHDHLLGDSAITY
jgi:hypothetical protein